jgi:hypothetical protein
MAKRTLTDDTITLHLDVNAQKAQKSIYENVTGGKWELADRIVIYLQTGEIVKNVNKQKCSSNFDWNKSTITLDTIITENYKNTENVRAFMTKEIGSHFSNSFFFLIFAVYKFLYDTGEINKNVRTEFPR